MQSGDSAEKENLAMHIAVCDDNVGDRKQMERLLKRESDKRALDTGVFYVDSYGNANAVMQSPMLYDAFFIDMTSEHMNGNHLVELLLQAGVTAPIILCVSSINYRETIPHISEQDHANIFYLDKPIKISELSKLLDLCIRKKSEHVTKIELRGEFHTRYVTEDDILYSKAVKNYMHVFLQDGSSIEIVSSVDNFYFQLESYTHYVTISPKTMINATHISNFSLFKVTLDNGTTLRIAPGYYTNIKAALQRLKNC